MIAVASPDKEWMTVLETAAAAGCTEGWVRLLLGDGRLKGWKAGARAWLIHRNDVEALKRTLTIRSVGRRDAKKATPKPSKNRKK
jgi:excisionase family DNA binding protein